jgi:HK97 family phage prohead protease
MSKSLRHLSVELRAATDAPEGVVVGYATVWNTEYPIGYGQKEVIQRGAFADSIKRQSNKPVYLEHDWKAGPIGHLTAIEDETGLRIEAQLYIDTSERARNVFRAMQAGAMCEWSVGFLPDADGIKSDGKRPGLDIVTRGDLREASVVNMGANPDTSTVEVRTAETPEQETEEENLVDQIKVLLARLLAGEAQELVDGGKAQGAIRALLDVLDSLDWYAAIDDYEDEQNEEIGVENRSADLSALVEQIENPAARAVLRELI